MILNLKVWSPQTGGGTKLLLLAAIPNIMQIWNICRYPEVLSGCNLAHKCNPVCVFHSRWPSNKYYSTVWLSCVMSAQFGKETKDKPSCNACNTWHQWMSWNKKCPSHDPLYWQAVLLACIVPHWNHHRAVHTYMSLNHSHSLRWMHHTW